jgi:hypothetical protein
MNGAAGGAEIQRFCKIRTSKELHKMATNGAARMAGKNNGGSYFIDNDVVNSTTGGDFTSLLKTPRNSLCEILQKRDAVKVVLKKRRQWTKISRVREPLLPWARSIKFSERVSVALVIQHAKRKSHIILSSLACLTVQYFSTSHKG